MPQPFTYRATGNITVCRFVVTDPNSPAPADGAGMCVLQAGLNAVTVGIADVAGSDPPIPSNTQSPPYAAQPGYNVRVHTLGSACLLQAGTGGWSAGQELQSDANGNGVPVAIDGKGRIGAIAISGAATGEYGYVQVVRYDKYGSPS